MGLSQSTLQQARAAKPEGHSRKTAEVRFLPRKKESLCYVIEAYGKRILMLGSLGIAADTEYPTGVDLALFPYQGSGHLHRIAAGIYQKLKPKAVLLIHFDDTFPPFSSDVDTSKIQKYLQERTAVYRLENGGSLEL